MVNLILTLLCIGALIYFVVDNIQTRKRQKAYISDEKNAINNWSEYLVNYINEEGFYLVVIRWNNAKDKTSLLFYAKDGYDAVSMALENAKAELNVDYSI